MEYKTGSTFLHSPTTGADDRFDDLPGSQVSDFAAKPGFIILPSGAAIDRNFVLLPVGKLAQHGAGPRKLCRMINVLMDMVHEFTFV